MYYYHMGNMYPYPQKSVKQSTTITSPNNEPELKRHQAQKKKFNH